jgi:hypothetical protein
MPPASVDDRVRRDTAHLPDELRGSVVLLRFAEPISRIASHHLMRVRLTQAMFDDGEDGSYRAGLVQPHRIGQRPCRACKQPRRQIAPTEQWCENPVCRMHRRRIECGPLAGVLKLLIADDFVEPDGRLSRVGLILDRRYNDRVLAGVYRAAGMLCDELGWRLL